MTAHWVKYDGSDEQLYEIIGSKYGFITEDGVHIECTRDCIIPDILSIGDKYLLCEPHQLADMICQWARTGQPVWYRALDYKSFTGQCLNDEFNLYPFARPDKYKYSFTPLEEEV